MLPAEPPDAVPANLPFQWSCTGSHSSNLMLDAALDLAVPSTRQNAVVTVAVLVGTLYGASAVGLTSVVVTPVTSNSLVLIEASASQFFLADSVGVSGTLSSPPQAARLKMAVMAAMARGARPRP